MPVPPPEATLASLEGLYVSSGFSIGPVVEAILQCPEFLDGPELVTPPVVFNAGLLRAVGRYIDSTAWAWLSAAAGQQLFYPPNVSGWDFTRWLDTSTAKARWEMATFVTSDNYPNPWPGEGEAPLQRNRDPGGRRWRARWPTGASPRSPKNRSSASANSPRGCLEGVADAEWQQSPYRAIRQNALRMLIATSPDMQVS